MNSNSKRITQAVTYLGVAVFCLCVWAFLEIAEDFPEGKFSSFDYAILRALRTPANAAVPRGPLWLVDVMRDASALGSASILCLTVTGVTGYLLLARQWGEGFAVTLACSGGWALNLALKALAGRPRPEVVPHLTEVYSSSFPSGHSMLSAIVYLSLGAVIARSAHSKWTATYAIGLAIFLTLVVGLTRIYLGVHYPTDVIAGWVAGTAWALLCVALHSAWIARKHFLRRTSAVRVHG